MYIVFTFLFVLEIRKPLVGMQSADEVYNKFTTVYVSSTFADRIEHSLFE